MQANMLIVRFTLRIFYVSDIDDCNHQPCVNGNCIDAINAYSCSCDSGFTGFNCSTGTILTKHSIPLLTKSLNIEVVYASIIKVNTFKVIQVH